MQRLHLRLKALMEILLETLEEQGTLRALIENQHYEVYEESGISQQCEIKLKGCMLELERTVQKVSITISKDND